MGRDNKYYSIKVVLVLLGILFLMAGCGSNNDAEYLESSIDIVEDNNINSNIDIESMETDIVNMMDTIETLSATPRKLGTEEERQAYEFLSDGLTSYGYEIESQKFPYKFLTSKEFMFQKEIYFDFDYESFDGESQNLIAIKSANTDKNKGIIIVSAHYDTTSKCNGAIDNASGVSIVMELARNLVDIPSNTEVHFILFSGEENSLYGSRYYVSKLSVNERKAIICNINIDSVGAKGQNDAILGTADGEENNVTRLFEGYNMEIKKGPPSDYVPFFKVGIPALTIAQYPKDMNANAEEDIASMIDESKIKATADIVLQVILETIYESR